MKGFRGQEGATEGIRSGKFDSHRAGLLTISFPLFEDRMSFAVWKTLPSLPFLHLSLPNSAVISLFQRRNHAGKVVVLMVFQDCLQVRCIQLEKSVAIFRMLAFSRTVCQSSGQRKKEGFFLSSLWWRTSHSIFLNSTSSQIGLTFNRSPTRRETRESRAAVLRTRTNRGGCQKVTD